MPAPAAALSGIRTVSARTLLGIPSITVGANDTSSASGTQSDSSLSIPTLTLPENDNDRAALARGAARPSTRALDEAARAAHPALGRTATLRPGALSPPSDPQGAPRASQATLSQRPRNSVAPAAHASSSAAQAAFAATVRVSVVPGERASSAATASAPPAARVPGRDESTVELPTSSRARHYQKPLVAALVAASVTLGLRAFWPEDAQAREALANRFAVLSGWLHSAEQREPTAASSLAVSNAAKATVALQPPAPGIPVVSAMVLSPPPSPQTAPLMPPTQVAQPSAASAATAATTAAPVEARVAAPERAVDGPLAAESPAVVRAVANDRPVRSAPPTRAEVQRAKALTKQANAQLRQGRDARALSLYEAALRIAPNDLKALTGSARIALKRRDVASALSHARLLAQLRPRSATTQLLLGDAQQLAGDLTSARAAWTRAARLGSSAARARLRP
jgi:tetratricopeptide (TPR) repeat protein